jgi:predicted permease
MGIIGLAYCANAYGDMGLASASLYMGIITMLYNILAVITLSRGVEQPQGWRTMLVNIIKNPLIISIVLAWMVSWFQLRPPQLLIHTGQYFANLSLPLALLCAGATLSFKALRQDISTTLLASACKILFVPLGFVAGGLLLGFRGMDIGIILLMASAPTASASYVMARTMGANAQLAANIIVVTTLGSVITTSAAIMMLKSAGVM